MGIDAQLSVSELAQILDGEVLGSLDAERPVSEYAASDLLSDILAYSGNDYALLTGLTTAQVVRTADITGAVCVVILRGKKPTPEALQLAGSTGIPVIVSPCLMFEACSRISRVIAASAPA